MWDFFDQIDDLLEVPNDVEKGLVDNRVTGEYNDFPPVFWSGNSPVFSAASNNSASDLSAELSVPVSTFIFFTHKTLHYNYNCYKIFKKVNVVIDHLSAYEFIFFCRYCVDPDDGG